MLDVSLAAVLLVGLLAGDGEIQFELVAVLGILLHGHQFGVVQKAAGGGDAQDHPDLALVHVTSDRLFHEEPMQEASEWSDAGACRNQNDVRAGLRLKRFGIIDRREQHGLANGACNFHLGPGRCIAQEVAAHALLGRIHQARFWVGVLGASDAETDGAAIEDVAVSGGCDAVQPRLVGALLAVLGLLQSGRDDADGLALHVVHALGEFQHYVLDVARSIGSDQARLAENRGNGGLRRLGKVQRDGTVGIEAFQPVLGIQPMGCVDARGGGIRHERESIVRVFVHVLAALRQPVVQGMVGEQPLHVGIEQGTVAGRDHGQAASGAHDQLGIVLKTAFGEAVEEHR
mmetsp:Transcript_6435/g.19009  ORF Transcript_6435/g.19009 Transcript_6435/m.19009 type:complete len:345 (+) Transcript_6435:308-1342(+)